MKHTVAWHKTTGAVRVQLEQGNQVCEKNGHIQKFMAVPTVFERRLLLLVVDAIPATEIHYLSKFKLPSFHLFAIF